MASVRFPVALHALCSPEGVFLFVVLVQVSHWDCTCTTCTASTFLLYPISSSRSRRFLSFLAHEQARSGFHPSTR